MKSQIEQYTKRRDELILKQNSSGKWNSSLYDEVQELGKRISDLEKLPDPDEPELDLAPEVKPKKGR